MGRRKRESLVVYLATNLVTGKVYIGQTFNLKQRKWAHFSNALLGKKHPFYAAIRKYGRGNFAFSVICHCFDLETSNCIEEMMISKYCACNRRYGYNISKSASHSTQGLHFSLTKKQLKRLSGAQKGNTNALGKHWKWSKKSLKRANSKITFIRSSKPKKYVFSEEHRQRIAKAKRGERSPAAKLTEIQVLKIRKLRDISCKDLAAHFGVTRSHISHIRTGRYWSHLKEAI